MENSVIKLLKLVPLFAELDDTTLLELARECRPKHYKKNETLFRKGDPGHTLYIVCSGRVNVQNENSEGEPLHIAQRGPGEYFGEMALLDGKPRMADVVTTTPAEVLTLHRDVFMRCLENKPQMAMRVMAVLADRLREAAAQLETYQELDVLGRVANALYTRLLSDSAPNPGGGKRLKSKVTQHQLAGEVSASRESVNRALKNLKLTGVIRTEVRVLIVLNEERLRQIGSR